MAIRPGSLKQFAEVQTGQRGGHFVLTLSGLKRYLQPGEEPGMMKIGEPINRGPGPVITREQADEFSKGSKFPQPFFRGTSYANEGVQIAEKTPNMSLMGRGVYMVQSEDAAVTAKYGAEKTEVRVNVKTPIDRYGADAKIIEKSPEFAKALEEAKKSKYGNWQTHEALAFQAVAQARGHDSVYYKIEEGTANGGVHDTGRVALCVWDAQKVAMVKGEALRQKLFGG